MRFRKFQGCKWENLGWPLLGGRWPGQWHRHLTQGMPSFSTFPSNQGDSQTRFTWIFPGEGKGGASFGGTNPRIHREWRRVLEKNHSRVQSGWGSIEQEIAFFWCPQVVLCSSIHSSQYCLCAIVSFNPTIAGKWQVRPLSLRQVKGLMQLHRVSCVVCVWTQIRVQSLYSYFTVKKIWLFKNIHLLIKWLSLINNPWNNNNPVKR